MFNVLFWGFDMMLPHLCRNFYGITILAKIISNCPLARNQYINNSPELFPCIRAGANTGATCICVETNSLKNLAIMRKMLPQKYLLYSRECEYRPRMYSRENYSPKIFPACIINSIGFCAGG